MSMAPTNPLRRIAPGSFPRVLDQILCDNMGFTKMQMSQTGLQKGLWSDFFEFARAAMQGGIMQNAPSVCSSQSLYRPSGGHQRGLRISTFMPLLGL